MSTKLLYMEQMYLLDAEAHVNNTDKQNERVVVYLDETIFYPQGGGQPYDKGVIENDHAKFIVDEVRFIECEVLHIGHYDRGELTVGDAVMCHVDPARRQLHTRLHSAGHLVDMAVNELGYEWVPGKGYHFPDAPYIEYSGNLGGETPEEIVPKIEAKMSEILSRGLKTEIKFMPKEEMTQYCRYVPDYLPAGKPGRIVLYGNFGVPCGGTHVAELSDIGPVKLRKLKAHGNTIHVAYEL